MHLKHKMAMAVAAALAAVAVSPAIHAAPRFQRMAGHHVNQGLEASPGDGYCDPFADWDWEYEDGSGDSAGGQLRAARSGLAFGQGVAADAAAQAIGTTPEAIERNFTGVVTRNLAGAGTATRVARLSDRELGAIARHVARGAPVERAALLKLFATRLDGPALVRVARAFGRAPVEAAVRAYADPATRAAFAEGVAGLSAPPPEGGGGGGNPYPSPAPPRPNLNMTLEEIYLEFRTAPLGGLTPSAALAETAMYAGPALYLSYQSGKAVGTAISGLIRAYAPGVDEAIGTLIGSMIENYSLASSEVQQGHFQSAFDDLFGFQLTWSSDPAGDWNIAYPMVDYYQSDAVCGF